MDTSPALGTSHGTAAAELGNLGPKGNNKYYSKNTHDTKVAPAPTAPKDQEAGDAFKKAMPSDGAASAQLSPYWQNEKLERPAQARVEKGPVPTNTR